MSKFLIYALTDPQTGQWRYIGKSTSGFKRPRRHVRQVETKTHKGRWVSTLLRRGLEPLIELVEELPAASLLSEAERDWIAAARALGVPLTNSTPGGEGCSGPKSPETRAKMRAAALARGPEWSAKASAAMRKHKRTREHSAALAAALTGRKLPPEVKKKISAAGFRRAPPSAATRAKISAAHLGRTRSEETRAKLQHAAQNRSEETIAKMRASALLREQKKRLAWTDQA